MTLSYNILSSLTEWMMDYFGQILTIGVILIIALIVFNIVRYLSHRKTKELLYNDPLTGIRKSEYLKERFQDIMTDADGELTFYYINIDNFKNHNALFGYAMANRLLAGFASRLESVVDDEGYLGRVHSDRFVVIYPQPYRDVQATGRIMLEKLREPFTIDNQEMSLTVSVGSYHINSLSARFQDALYFSELALERAKNKGKDKLVEYTDDLKKSHDSAFEMFRVIKKALKHNEFFLEFQPIVATEDERIVGFESLLRFHDKHRLLFTAEIINYAERFNLIGEIDRFVVKRSFETYQKLVGDGVPFEFLALNISSSEVHNEWFIDYLVRMARQHDVPPSSIIIEFTETVDPEKIENEFSFIDKLREHGFKIAIDDFGSGYSSMMRLSKSQLDRIKIDKTFLNDLEESESNRSLIRAMVNLADEFDLDVICEGVETREAYDFIRSLGVKYVQGYLFYKPLTLDYIINTFTNKNDT